MANNEHQTTNNNDNTHKKKTNEIQRQETINHEQYNKPMRQTANNAYQQQTASNKQ